MMVIVDTQCMLSCSNSHPYTSSIHDQNKFSKFRMFLELRSMVLLFTIYLLDSEILTNIILMTFTTALQSHICSI